MLKLSSLHPLQEQYNIKNGFDDFLREYSKNAGNEIKDGYLDNNYCHWDGVWEQFYDDIIDRIVKEEEQEEAGAPPPAPSPPATKRTYKCSVCGITGHNKTTCPQKK